MKYRWYTIFITGSFFGLLTFIVMWLFTQEPIEGICFMMFLAALMSSLVVGTITEEKQLPKSRKKPLVRKFQVYDLKE